MSEDLVQHLGLNSTIIEKLAEISSNTGARNNLLFELAKLIERERDRAFVTDLKAEAINKRLEEAQKDLERWRRSPTGEQPQTPAIFGASEEEFNHMREQRDAYRRLTTAVLEELRWLDEGVEHLHQGYAEALYRAELEGVVAFEPRYINQIKVFRKRVEALVMGDSLQAPAALSAHQGAATRMFDWIRKIWR